MEPARAEASRASIEAENARSQALIAMKPEEARLEAMLRILAEMAKPAEKIQGISINHQSGLGGARGGNVETAGSPANATVDAIMDLAIHMPA